MGDGASEACKREMLRKVALMAVMWLTLSFSIAMLFYLNVDNFFIYQFMIFGTILFIGFLVAIASISASDVVVDDEKISYSTYFKRKRKLTHLWNEVAESRITPGSIVLIFSDGTRAIFPGTRTVLGQEIAAKYFKEEGEGEEPLIDELPEKISNYFAMIIVAYVLIFLLLYAFVLRQIGILLFLPLLIGLMILRFIYWIIQRLLITRIVVGEYVKYSLDLKESQIKTHSWDDITTARIGPRFIYFKFSNGDKIIISGTKTAIGRKVAEAYESYLKN